MEWTELAAAVDSFTWCICNSVSQVHNDSPRLSWWAGDTWRSMEAATWKSATHPVTAASKLPSSPMSALNTLSRSLPSSTTASTCKALPACVQHHRRHRCTARATPPASELGHGQRQHQSSAMCSANARTRARRVYIHTYLCPWRWRGRGSLAAAACGRARSRRSRWTPWRRQPAAAEGHCPRSAAPRPASRNRRRRCPSRPRPASIDLSAASSLRWSLRTVTALLVLADSLALEIASRKSTKAIRSVIGYVAKFRCLLGEQSW